MSTRSLPSISILMIRAADKKEKTMNETKHQRFCKVAEKRVNQVIADLEKLGNCSARVSYDYTDAEVELIISAIECEVHRLRERFAGKRSFSLSDDKEGDPAWITD